MIGRSKDCDLRLNSRLVSGHHGAIVPTAASGYVVVDLDSTNGLLVNGKFVKFSALNDGDVIDISDFRIRVELNETGTVADKEESLSYAEEGDTDIMPAPDIGPQRERLAGKL